MAEILPLFGFYLQSAVGGRVLSQSFWRQFVEIPNVYAIKIAPFNRYQTMDVMRAVAESNRWRDLALYTGNDDQIVLDLLGEWVFDV
ncbi:MAG: dihydrodipicolinate synthase family protein, partial [Verrucomicrobia bacterium]|nr:dihydrodipicolinate synthase family protein [Verrucomicrobiota bacterium]